MSISAAIIGRWNALNLNTSFAPLYLARAADTIQSYSASATKAGGAPEGTLLPRAIFDTLPPEWTEKTTGCKVWDQSFFVYVFAKTMPAIDTVLDTIREGFEKSNGAGTNPFVMSGATVMNVDHVGDHFFPVRHDVFAGEIQFDVMFSRASAVPA